MLLSLLEQKQFHWSHHRSIYRCFAPEPVSVTCCSCADGGVRGVGNNCWQRVLCNGNACPDIAGTAVDGVPCFGEEGIGSRGKASLQRLVRGAPDDYRGTSRCGGVPVDCLVRPYGHFHGGHCAPDAVGLVALYDPRGVDHWAVAVGRRDIGGVGARGGRDGHGDIDIGSVGYIVYGPVVTTGIGDVGRWHVCGDGIPVGGYVNAIGQ